METRRKTNTLAGYSRTVVRAREDRRYEASSRMFFSVLQLIFFFSLQQIETYQSPTTH